MKLSRGDWEKTKCGFKAGIIDNTESEFKKSTKLWLQITDWIYIKWNRTDNTAYFPIALIQDTYI